MWSNCSRGDSSHRRVLSAKRHHQPVPTLRPLSAGDTLGPNAGRCRLGRSRRVSDYPMVTSLDTRKISLEMRVFELLNIKFFKGSYIRIKIEIIPLYKNCPTPQSNPKQFWCVLFACFVLHPLGT